MTTYLCNVIIWHSQRAERETLAMRIRLLQNELDWRTNQLRAENHKYEIQQTENIQKGTVQYAKF